VPVILDYPNGRRAREQKPAGIMVKPGGIIDDKNFAGNLMIQGLSNGACRHLGFFSLCCGQIRFMILAVFGRPLGYRDMTERRINEMHMRATG
jgi:hypothetical protein